MEGSTSDKRNGNNKRRDAHDWATLGILTLTLVAAAVAAGCTGYQAWIARDQEHRALRAYVVLGPSLKGDFANPANAFAMIDSENMGQTPVYNLMVNMTTDVKLSYEPLSHRDEMSIDCDFVFTHNGAIGKTFRKSYTEGLGFSRPHADILPNPLNPRDVIYPSYGLYAYGTVCYQDIFRDTHYVRFCYVWWDGNRQPHQCPDEQHITD